MASRCDPVGKAEAFATVIDVSSPDGMFGECFVPNEHLCNTP
jgi:hypothetical protein